MKDYFIEKYNIKLPRKLPVSIELPFMRDYFPVVFNELGYKVGAEIGVFKGEYTLDLAKSGLKIYAIDPWTAYHDFPDQSIMDSYFEETKQRLAGTTVDIIRKPSLEAVKAFKDGSLDFVYIDGDHELKGVLDDIWHWYPKVRSGGMIAGHDFIRFRNQCKSHVPEAVWAYVQAYRIPYFFTTERKGAMNDLPKNSQRSWFWIKP